MEKSRFRLELCPWPLPTLPAEGTQNDALQTRLSWSAGEVDVHNSRLMIRAWRRT